MTDLVNTERHRVYSGFKTGNIKKEIFDVKNLYLSELKDVLNHKKNEEWSFSKSKDEFKDDVFVFKFTKGEYLNEIKGFLEKLSISPNITYNLKDGFTILIYFLDVKIKDKEIIKYVFKGFEKLLLQNNFKSVQFENYWYPTGNNVKVHKEENTEFFLFHALAEIGHLSGGKYGTELTAKEKSRRGEFKNGIELKKDNYFIKNKDEKFYKSLRYSEGYIKSKVPRLKEAYEIGNADFRELFSLGSLLTKTKMSANECNKILKKCSLKKSADFKKIAAGISRVFLNNAYPEINFFDKDVKDFYSLSDLFNCMPNTEYYQNENIELLELEQIELQFKEFMHQFLKIDKGEISGDEEVHFLKAAAGIGKTETILKLRNSVIAFPTHDLKNDFVDRITRDYPEIKFRATPKLPEFSNNLNEQFKFLYESGKQALVEKLLSDLIDNPESMGGNSVDKKLATEYVQELNQAYEIGEFLILTTHHRAIFTKFERPLIVFDEDPHNLLLEQSEFNIKDFEEFVKRFNAGTYESIALLKLLDFIKNSDSKKTYITPSEDFAESFKELSKKITGQDKLKAILNFLSSHSFYKEADSIKFIMSRALPEGVTCLVMSASLPINLYQNLCGDRVGGFKDISLVKHKGIVEQFPYETFSKTRIKKWSNFIEERTNKRFVITYKAYCLKFNKSLDKPKIYFFNCSGYDELKGKEIMVVGTPYYEIVRYKLLASVLGIPIDNINYSIHTVIRNGRSAKFRVLNEPRIRDIQLDLLEGELLQAIGRARALRESNAKVSIYTCFPLPQFVKINVQEKNRLDIDYKLVPVETL